MSFRGATVWLRRRWWGSAATYIGLAAWVYATIWIFIEPLDIPAELRFGTWLTAKRSVVHVAVSLLTAIHLTLVLDLLHQFRRREPLQAVIAPRNPALLVSGGPLTYADVELGLRLLCDYAREFKPDMIVGINRGGAIVGGCVAKRLGHPFVTLVIVNCDKPPGRRVVECRPVESPFAGRILVVDDAFRKGEHMREALTHLSKRYPGLTLRSAVLLKADVAHFGPERKAFRDGRVDKAVFHTMDAAVTLPWDPPRPDLPQGSSEFV